MNLTKEKLKTLWEKKYFNNKSEITERFDKFEKIIVSGSDSIKNEEVEPFYYNINKDLLGSDFKGNIESIKDYYKDTDKEQFQNYLYFIGGIESIKNLKFKDSYRLISNKQDDYSGSLSSGGIYQRPNSNFITNNTPSVIFTFIKQCKDDENVFNSICDKAKIVLSWPEDILKVDGEDYRKSQNIESLKRLINKSNEILEKKFITKFLWMWSNEDEVIHPISLMAFRNFLDSEFGKDILKNLDKNYTPELVINMKFDDFKEIWKKISNKILENLEVEKNIENIKNISKLISQVCIEETDIKNISDLLVSGNKAVILWGPPGTGKTYESEVVVKELLGVEEDKDFEEKYLFSKGDMDRNTQGYYEIVQFHPNYTYQDFIGGISPKLDGNSVSYELREGIFKRFCDAANKNKNKKFIFIIDEINRAELSAVFGELLYALEYRGKSINLPHFGEFTIPLNVYIIGTMNNVDKSLITFDLALRRRFGFFKLMPKLEVIQDVLGEVVEENSLDNYYRKCKQLNILVSKSKLDDNDKLLFNNIKNNENLFLDLGEDYQIGQAYFLKIRDFLQKDENEKLIENQNITSFELEKLWIYNLEPLLEEYLGMNIEDSEIKSKLKQLKEEFLKDN